ncbi:hypothetical protein [Thermomonas paludicola]|jgi:hypothetical protein|uniref:hypothetical protein n=1 Tax=Thermomonas paludicola TaxID=2884874 RepID=UPI0021156F3D|nr:hypothetical protein [Thermomonas paludicola]
MTLWKSIKDRAALDRLQDEAYHAAAVDEISSGQRRDGLWAKAIIESGGDEVRAKVAYLRLLVVALRDEHYLATRVAELHPDPAPPARPDSIRPGPVRDKSVATRCAEAIQNGRATFETYADLLATVGGSIESKGFLFGMHYVVNYGGRQVRVDHFDDLQGWFVKSVIPNLGLNQI